MFVEYDYRNGSRRVSGVLSDLEMYILCGRVRLCFSFDGYNYCATEYALKKNYIY